jgi:hypothetical protein
MIETYIKHLVDNLPTTITQHQNNNNKCYDIVLDGGAFNGSYLIGALLLMRELEKNKYITIDKISGSSVGSIVAFLYHLDALHVGYEFYDIFTNKFKNEFILDEFNNFFERLEKHIPDNICETMSDRVYITYYNVKRGKKIIKSKYKTKRDIFETIKRSCFIPFVTNGQFIYKNKYIDGLTPYILPEKKHKKIIYFDLFNSDKIEYILSIKNESNNCHRIMNGILDMHLFFIKNTATSMCSYVNNWTIYNISYRNRCIKVFVEQIVIFIMFWCLFIKNALSDKIFNVVYKSKIYKSLFKKVSKMAYNAYVIAIKHNCL